MAEVKDNTVYHDDPVYISYAGKSDSVYSTANHTVEAIDKERTRDSSVTALIKHFDSRKIPYIKDTIDIKGGRIPDFERKIGQAKRVVIFLSDKYFISPHTMYEWDLIHQNKEVKTIRYVYYTDEKDVFRYYYFVNAKNEKEYNEFVNNSKKASLYDTGVTAIYGEQLMTLSTCDYNQENGRFAVVAKKIK